MAQSVEHVIGNDEVISSILITSSKKGLPQGSPFFAFYKFYTVPVMVSVATPGETAHAPVVGSCT